MIVSQGTDEHLKTRLTSLRFLWAYGFHCLVAYGGILAQSKSSVSATAAKSHVISQFMEIAFRPELHDPKLGKQFKNKDLSRRFKRVSWAISAAFITQAYCRSLFCTVA